MYQVHIIENVPYVGFATYRRATVKIRLYFKRLIFMQMFCIRKIKKYYSKFFLKQKKKKKKKKNKKKNRSSQQQSNFWWKIRDE